MKHVIPIIIFPLIGSLVVGCATALDETGVEPRRSRPALEDSRSTTKKDPDESQAEMAAVSHTPAPHGLELNVASLVQPASHPAEHPTILLKRPGSVAVPLSRPARGGPTGFGRGVNKALDEEAADTSLPTQEATEDLGSGPGGERATGLARVVDGAFDGRAVEASLPAQGRTADVGSKQADALILQAGRLGREALSERSLKKGRRAMKLLRHATTVAPDYRRGWEVYSRSLANLQARLGHSLVMHDSEINREIQRCNHALTRLR